MVKSHMPYRLDQQRLAHWSEWFLKPDYAVTALPSDNADSASDPFLTFRQLPSRACYCFMLQYTLMGFIKSPVCRGQLDGG